MTLGAAWQRVCIKDVCESIIDCVNKTAPVVEFETPYKMIRTTNVKSGWVNLLEVRYVTEETYQNWTRRSVPKKGDVILTREAPLGEVGMLRSNDLVFLGQRLVQYRANPKRLDNRFLLYTFQEADLQGQIRSFGSGFTVEHMRVPDCEKITLRLPTLKTQERIADKSMSGATGRQRVQDVCFDAFLFAHPDKRTLSKFSKIISQMFRQIYVLAQKNRNLRQARDLLLPKLISGEIDVEALGLSTLDPGETIAA